VPAFVLPLGHTCGRTACKPKRKRGQASTLILDRQFAFTGCWLVGSVEGIPRQVRIQYPGAIYHVMSRGNRRQEIYLDDVDRQGNRRQQSHSSES